VTVNNKAVQKVCDGLVVEFRASGGNVGTGLELRHPRCVCNIKVQCKEVKNATSLLSVIMLLIE